MKRLLVVLMLVSLFAVLVVGCSSERAEDSAQASDKEPYVIGAIFTTTGDNAPLGVPEQKTVKMIEKQINAEGGINGRPVKVEYYDDSGDPSQAVKACRQLLSDDNVLAIVGPTLSGPSLAIASMCEESGMPYVSCAASVKIVEPVRSYVFKTAQSDCLAVERLLDYLKAQNIKTVGFINDANAFGASGREQWQALSGKAGIQTVAMESFNTGDTDMTSQLTKIRSKNPQAVVCWGTNPGPAIVAKNMKTLGMKQKLFMSHGIANKKFIELAGPASEGVIFPAGKLLVAKDIADSDPQKDVLLKYAADYEAECKESANTFGGHAYDAFKMVLAAIEKAGDDKAKIREELEATKEFVGISGVFNMSPDEHNGLCKDCFALIQIKDGNWTLVQ